VRKNSLESQKLNETSRQNYEWHRERLLREKQSPNAFSSNRAIYNITAIEKKHGAKAAAEATKEFNSKKKKDTKYFT
jgi:hypothetical protein